MNVQIDGVSYVPWNQVPQPPSQWRLTTGHLEAAKDWPDWHTCLTWAMEAEGTVEEMVAWRTAMHKQDGITEPPKKMQPLPVPGKRKELFS